MIRSELISQLAAKHPQFTASDFELAVKTIIDSIVNHYRARWQSQNKGEWVALAFVPDHQDWVETPGQERKFMCLKRVLCISGRALNYERG